MAGILFYFPLLESKIFLWVFLFYHFYLDFYVNLYIFIRSFIIFVIFICFCDLYNAMDGGNRTHFDQLA